ncbi:Mss4-like protein [Mariannaea sp. PMI_226]|nr:Mss4-like protein [Mariannaea sp. PMI_226]
MSLSGSCMCGAVAYAATGGAEFSALCHCVDCQKWTGGPYTSNAVVSEDSFSVTKGTPKQCDMVGGSGKINHHFFCGDCGSSLFTRLDVMPGKVCIKAGGLDNGAASLDNKINVELYCKDRVAYLAPIEGATQNPTM